MNLPYSEYLNIALFLFSSIILFLFAIDSLGRELLDLATENFRKVVSKLAKNRSGARQKPSRKVLTQYADETAIVKFFVGPGATSVRVAETPGDIIRRTLRGTI